LLPDHLAPRSGRGISELLVGTSTTFARVSPWALLAAALLMGATLLATVWTTHRGVLDASETLERGQAGLLVEGIRTRLGALTALPDEADLREVLSDLEPEGLTYVATCDRSGAVLASAGERVGPLPSAREPKSEARPGAPIPVGDRLRVVVRNPMGRSWRRLAAAAGADPSGAAGPSAAAGVGPSGAAGAGPDGPSDSKSANPPWGGHRPGPLVMEFEPRVAAGLRAAAGRTLAIGAVAAGGLLVLALALFRWILHREALERRLEHERRLASLGQMSAVLAHEIRNPLASLKGNAQLLARALPEGEKPRAKADRVVGEAIRLETLTNDLLEFARTGAIQREPTDPAALLGEAAAAAGEGRVALDAAGAPASWLLDRPRMRQVLVNLIDNAVQSGAAPVEARVAAEAGQLIFSVRDRGPGIPAEDLPRLFEPFFSRRTQGTGLGLAVSKRLVELHGGTIQARNLPDGGAEFSVSLPRA
jgi:two-component system sensor histidine kinase HydH